jgi:cell wall-associated NlpC family hydrolase
VRFRALGSTVLCIITLSVTTATAVTTVTAMAATGGVAPGGSTAASSHSKKGGSSKKGGTSAGNHVSSAKPTPLVHRHTAPVTSRSMSLDYTGPVYEKTATGQVVPYQSPQVQSQAKVATGGSPVGIVGGASKPELLVPGHLARVIDGLAAAPIYAPAGVQQMIWAGNQIIGLPYVFGGGHASFASSGYDCSGTVSFALHGAGLLHSPEDSSEFMRWGSHGVGSWVTVFSNPGHAYMTVAGLRLDTSAADDPSNQQGPRWRPLRPGNGGFTVRHPTGL